LEAASNIIEESSFIVNLELFNSDFSVSSLTLVLSFEGDLLLAIVHNLINGELADTDVIVLLFLGIVYLNIDWSIVISIAELLQ